MDAMTKIRARTRNQTPRHIRAAVKFGPRFGEHEVTGEQLEAIQADPHLEVRVLESAPQPLEGGAKDLIEKAAKLDAQTAAEWLVAEGANKNRPTVVGALEKRLAELKAE